MHFSFLISILILINRISLNQCLSYDCSKLNQSISSQTFDANNSTITTLNLNQFSRFADLKLECNQTFNFEIIIQLNPTSPAILDSSLSLAGLKLARVDYFLYFSNIIGIDVETNPKFGLSYNPNFNFMTMFSFSELQLFIKRQKLDNADACLSLFSNSPQLLSNNYFTRIEQLFFEENIVYRSKLCPLLFNNTLMVGFYAAEIANSFINKNILEFFHVNESLGSTIKAKSVHSLQLGINYETITSRLVNKYVFKEMNRLEIVGLIYDIEADLFKSFDFVSRVYLHVFRIGRFFRNGNRWLEHLGFNLPVYDLKKLGGNTEVNVLVTFYNFYATRVLIEVYEYPDEDFCLFARFPHEKLVYPLIYLDEKLNCSCTLLFLIQYSSLYLDQVIMFKVNYGKTFC
jgi:hypothetical protein